MMASVGEASFKLSEDDLIYDLIILSNACFIFCWVLYRDYSLESRVIASLTFRISHRESGRSMHFL